ncbi:hypothetical protein EJ05DRAFT_482545 [Pseudovirgaria hyperparasitica]|uniref:Gem-associated protein 5 TPR domain-containing protein n=1 Tax=Pseudovirgaria hyperparasitica TaxID=470096 RepID=A0A6A6WJ00_9PEZI|nr:uncharacterized protein EJ05DRAFT_482545 [Pseudovirgaria hyperparasitica]KAF2761697.1 hypothetical protein EJ05DRAFT_482545 [Pseudovirgaria hyperparasitica]
MSTAPLSSRQRSASRSSNKSANLIPPPAPSITPKQDDVGFEPSAATASFFLYAQRNVILCLHHDTLAIERRFTGHREDVVWIYVDNISERGAGRLVVSYDTGNTAIVWDLLTGDEVARFASYEHIRVAAWMRNGNVAFGNSQGNVILFEPSTSEHVSARTIFDPITALAPVADCRTFAIGYLNGSILIATLQPAFTILHTLTTPRSPSPIIGLSWHGSSSRQKSEMLATQTQDGDLRVWSVPKAPHAGDPPCVIRVLCKTEVRESGPVWFNWSKTGRIVQYSEGQTYAWDVRTKRVSFDTVPTIPDIVGITNYGPTATLFTLGRNHTVQQYDINPNGTPQLVQNVQHVPANTPPSPPNSIDELKARQQQPPIPQDTSSELSSQSETSGASAPYGDTTSSENEAGTMSPLQRIAQEMDQLEEERRDRVGPLSPTSSRASMSSRSSGGARRRYRYDKPSSTRLSATSSESTGTIFSVGSSKRSGHESISIRSTSSAASSSAYKPSSLRREYQKMREEPQTHVDLFPFVKARLSEVPYQTPTYSSERTVDEMRQQMISVVFGWDDTVEALIRDQLARHKAGSASAILLSKWLGDDGSDIMASMIGSESMSSSDWMLLALSAMGADSQKKVGQAFTQRLLEKGDIHPAAAILLGLGEQNDAIEVYVSRRYYLEAVLLTCLMFPNDWQRQSYLVRKWGEVAVAHKQPELAVRCFSCTSLESAEPWFSPAAQDAVFHAQKESVLGSQLSPPLSPPSAGMPSRMKNSSLKLITSFNPGGGAGQRSTTDEMTPMNLGITPIAESAISPGGATPWARQARGMREPSSARTATPGSYTRRKRYPSRSDVDRSTSVEPTPIVPPTRRQTPQTAIENQKGIEIEIPLHRRSASSSAKEPFLLSAVAYDPTKSTASTGTSLPSPAVGVFTALQESRSRNGSRSRKPGDLHLDMGDMVIREAHPSSVRSIANEPSPPLTGHSMGGSLKSAKIRSIDQYISSLDEASHHARQQRAESRKRGTSREPTSRSRQASESRGRAAGVKYIKPAKRSPSSPVSMSPDDAHLFSSQAETFDAEQYYKVTSPTESKSSRTGRVRSRSKAADSSSVRASSKMSRKARSPDRIKASSRTASRNRSRQRSTDRGAPSDIRGRTLILETSHARSPSSPLPMSSQAQFYREDEEDLKDGAVADTERRLRQRSRSQRPGERGTSSRRERSPDRRVPRERSSSRRPGTREQSRRRETAPTSPDGILPPTTFKNSSTTALPRLTTDFTVDSSVQARKEQAQRELEERRLSLARRPSAPVIPLPGDFARPIMERANSNNEFGNSPTSALPSFSYADRVPRSQTAEPEFAGRYKGPPKTTFGHSTPSTPIGLPATPRAMRHPRYMSQDQDRDVPDVPQIPSNMQRSPLGEQPPAVPGDDLAPLLPSTTYGQPVTKPPSRTLTMSAPIEKNSPTHGHYSAQFGNPHSRRISSGAAAAIANANRISPTIRASIDETISGDNQIIVIEGGPTTPPMLPELRHLSTPPPPPPPPMFPNSNSPSTLGSGVINIAIDEMNGNVMPISDIPPPPPPVLQAPVTTTSPVNGHRRGRGSVSESIGSRLRGVTERMRSASRSQNKSPPVDPHHHSPYESIPPMDLHRRGSVSHGKSSSSESISDIQPLLPAFSHGQSLEQQQPSIGYVRGPKEIRANMPPDYLQWGAAPPNMI